MEKNEFDVLVAGGGPAGAQAAHHAALKGAEVLLVDRKRRFGALPHCAEFVPKALGLEIEIPEKAKVQAISGMETWLDEERVFSPGPGWILDRQVFDFDLACKAASAGATLWSSATIKDFKDNIAQIKVAGKDLKVSTKVFVAAFGAGSSLADSLDLAKPKYLVGTQVVVPLTNPLDRTLIFLEPQLKGGYGWLFPRGTVANLGLGCVAESRPQRCLEQLRLKLLQKGLIKPGILARGGGAIPLSGIREHKNKDNLLFCGDALGLTHPITGAGIPQAVFSGWEAGKAAFEMSKGINAQEEYYSDIKLRYGRYLERALKARKLLDENWGKTDFNELMKETWPAWALDRKRKAKKAK